MSKPWGSIGNWAAEAEREEREQEAAAAAATTATGNSQSFPSLKEAASTKQKKKKNKMSLQDFYEQAGAVGTRRDSGTDRKGLTPDEMVRLPTGPKERSAEEMQYGSRLGGGFSSFGRASDGDSSWGGGNRRSSYGGFDDDDNRRGGPPPSRGSDFDQPSRADEVDNWAMGKKSLPSVDSGRSNRYSSLGGGGGMSRADDVDNWGAGKRSIPVRSSNFGSGFHDSAPREGEQRRRLVLNPPRAQDAAVVEPARTNKSSPFGAARPREEVLAEKGLDWKKLDLDIEEKKTSRPTSSHSSRPSSAQSSRSEGPTRSKVNPFGDAKPREILLQEKGMDWRKMDLELEHRSVERPETEAEKNLKQEIDDLKKELEKESALSDKIEPVQGSGEDHTSLHVLLQRKEKELELLIRELDDKVRFGPKSVERPGSGAGRGVGIPERLPSQSGVLEDSRNMEFMERPRSRGNVDVWTRQGEDRRAFQGNNRERGFLGSRDMGRSRSRERW